MSPQIVNFVNEFYSFNEIFSYESTRLLFNTYDCFIYLIEPSLCSFLQITNDSNLYTKSIITFINQTEDINLYNSLENITSVYHYSIPNTKLAYPEPFIASPSFMHTDLWFIHILVYQYWLWFIFVFIIVFFFITFVCTLRWCNMRIRPRRETRGVSRSKCGDLVTAIVPVTWATSIIVNESTDAIDYYDGFGTTELVVGIRAYQWGWEYYYPKDIDLNYNIKANYSTFVGNSLKYNKASDVNLSANNLWKFYQNKTFDHVITPAHILALPVDNYKLFNFLNFNDVGASSTQESNAFKRVRMFSKTFTSNLVFASNNFSNKYKIFSNLYINDNLFTDSYLYGLKRQHNFLSTNSILNNHATFLDLNSVKKIINFNFQNNYDSLRTNQIQFYNFFKKQNISSFDNKSLRINYLFNMFFKSSNTQSLAKMSEYNKFISLINDNSDKKKLNYPIVKLFNKRFKKANFYNLVNLNKLNLTNDTVLIKKNNELENMLNNISINYKTAMVFSPNQSISLGNRYVRNFINSSPNLSNYNYSLNLNSINNYMLSANKQFGLNSFFFLNSSNSRWTDLFSTSKLALSKINYDYPQTPVISNHPGINNINYDNLKNSFIEDIPSVLQGKEELMPISLNSIYWNTFWSTSSMNWKFYNNQVYHTLHRSFYLPMFNFYYDYDFRNWQSMELLEDAYWESIYSIYAHDEYTTLTNDYSEYEYFDKFNNMYNKLNRITKFKDKIISKPFFKNTNSVGNYYSGTMYLDDFVTSPTLTPTKDFFIFPLFSVFTHIEDSYENVKNVNHLFNISNKIFLTSTNNNFQTHNYFFIFDMFRSDYDEFSWFKDENNHFSSLFKNLMGNWSTATVLDYLALFDNKSAFFTSYWTTDVDTTMFNFNENITSDKTYRFSNNLNIRSSVKNSIVTYNAIQKVFRARFDENRSNTKLGDFGFFYTKQPFISSPRTPYEKILGKTKENFFKINLYKNNFHSLFNNFYETNSSLNFYFYDFPFLLAMKSDASRYLWFDWFAKWGFYEVQPSSASRYAIYGMPYFSKNFEFSTVSGENLNESETYLLRLAHARRNYLPNWTYTPYFYAKNTNWYRNNLIYEIFSQTNNLLVATQFSLLNSNWYWEQLYFINYHNYQFFPSHSGISSYSKLNWKPQNSIQSYYYSVSNLIDILTKREFLYRELFLTNKRIVNLPFYLTNNPNNPLINEIKASFLFVDPIIYNNEYSRDIFFSSLNFFNFTVLKSFLASCNDFINLSIVSDYLFYYFFNANFTNTLQSNNELYKNQYRPMRKGITNMIRLHATGAIAMPIEIRLQLLASSKDVIHSWAIPSAGIKIDCIPGYSSHKVIIFLVSGIFWGQCMEICGRYHHWMPIVVYFMKRDLFFLWCTHFVFLTGSNNMWNINDRQFTDYIRTVSFDKYSWLSEINN